MPSPKSEKFEYQEFTSRLESFMYNCFAFEWRRSVITSVSKEIVRRVSLQTHFHAKNTEWLMDFLLSRVHCTMSAQKTKKCLTRRWYTAGSLLLMIGCAELLFGLHDEDRRHIHSFWTDNHRVLDSKKWNFISKKRSISYDYLENNVRVHSTCSHKL